tara:strand:+ start:210 stop:1043 length:834 start_codon:yes stop_codon:yes gene_type:complete
LIKKIFYFYKSRGLYNTLRQLFKSILYRIGVKFEYLPRKAIINLAKARKIFSGRNLKYNSKGYWYVDPMPSKHELDEYYKLSYWDSFQPLNYGTSHRDLRHYSLLKKIIPNFDETKKKILNFGAGHGGISIIFNLLGHDVINVEPSKIPNIFNENWKTLKGIDDVKEEKFDLIYGSHSLEHVQDINNFHKKIIKLSKEETIFLWEVPNALHKNCVPMENRIDIPHTYYFEKKYFSNIYKKIIFLETYDSTIAEKLTPYDIMKTLKENADSLIVLAKN